MKDNTFQTCLQEKNDKSWRKCSRVHAALATRTIPLGEYWMTGDAGLPISSNSKKSILDALLRIEGEYDKPPEGPDGVALPIARASLAARAANYITYESAEASLRKPRREPPWPGFKRRAATGCCLPPKSAKL
jgi:hypothetical protein